MQLLHGGIDGGLPIQLNAGAVPTLIFNLASSDCALKQIKGQDALKKVHELVSSSPEPEGACTVHQD